MKDIISAGLAQMGLADRVPEQAPALLEEYGRFLLEKNQVMNLTAIRDEEGVARLHMLDSAGLLACTDLSGEKTLIDVGTGAGFPGAVFFHGRPFQPLPFCADRHFCHPESAV